MLWATHEFDHRGVAQHKRLVMGKENHPIGNDALVMFTICLHNDNKSNRYGIKEKKIEAVPVGIASISLPEGDIKEKQYSDNL
ncbi:MAG: hypothetical protein ACI30Y_01530 [Candidatus Limisoma sp.]